MASKKISQSEARSLRKRVEELETEIRLQRNRWRSDWGPGWVNIATFSLTEVIYSKLVTARLLKHAVIIVPMDDGTAVRMYAESLA